MRAKDYLELNEKGTYYYETVRKSIYELYPLRNNKKKTEDYFDRYLFADVRREQLKNGTGGEKAGDSFEEWEDEVGYDIAYRIRQEILNVISDDKTFIYAFNVIVIERNSYANDHKSNVCDSHEVNCKTEAKVEELIRLYKEDYPKSNLADYLLDEENWSYVSKINNFLKHDENWWLAAFNIAYELFDEMRVKLLNPFETKNIVINYTNEDKELQQEILGIVNFLCSKYKYDLTIEQEKKIQILSGLIDAYYKKEYESINYKEEYEKLKEKNEKWQEEIKMLEEENKNLEKENKGKAMTNAQQSIAFYYIFSSWGLNFNNSKKSDWAAYISKLTGRSIDNIRRFLKIDYENKYTLDNLLDIADLNRDLNPELTRTILRDCGYSADNMPPEKYNFTIEDL